MRGMPFNLQGKGVLEDSEISSLTSTESRGKWKKEHRFVNREPTSVLDTRRSPSPPTSTSTLSSSFGGGSGSTDSAGVAAVSDNPRQKWLPTEQQENSSAALTELSGAVAGDGGGGGSRKDEWGSELHPIPTPLEIGSSGGLIGTEKCGFGMEDWESMLTESGASLNQEHSLLRWINGDVEEPFSGLKHLLQSGNPPELESNSGFGAVDHGFGFESLGGSDLSTANLMGNVNPSLVLPGSGFPPNFNINNINIRVGSLSNPSSLSNHKVSGFGSDISSSSTNNPLNPIFSASPNNPALPFSLPPGVFLQQNQHQEQFESSDEKPQFFNPQFLINQQQKTHHVQNPPFIFPLSYGQQEQNLLLPPYPKRHQSAIIEQSFQNPKFPFSDSNQELFLRRQDQQVFPNQIQNFSLQQRPIMAKTKVEVGINGERVGNQNQNQQNQQPYQALLDQLFKAAEQVEIGNSILAQGILARLNHQLSQVGKPIQRAAFYFKEALQLLLLHMNTNKNNTTSPQRNLTPYDVVLKISAYKAFSEISPLLQFANFTSNQALLEALEGCERIHIIDFDIGLGGQWASFMQELAVKMGGSPLLKITAFASSSSHDPLELALTRENLTHFANDLGISFELNIANLDSLDPNSWSLAPHISENEAIAVNLPIGFFPNNPTSIPSLLPLVKQLSPKIVVSVDRCHDRSDLPFSQYFLHTLHSYSVLLDSLDSLNIDPDAVQKIERFLLLPKIESIVHGRHRAPDKIPPWKTLYASKGFSPLTFSNFTETQAECLVKRLQVRGFHVEKRQSSLVLFWQRRELVSVSAWRC